MARVRLIPIGLALALVAHAACGGIALAQERGAELGSEAIGLHVQDFAAAAVENGTPSAAGRMSMVMREANLAFPVAGFGSPAIWFIGAHGRDVSLRFIHFAPALSPFLAPELDSRDVIVGTSRQYAADRAFVGALAMGRFSLGSDSSAPLSTGGYALWRFLLSRNARWGVGVSATAALGAPAWVPLLEYVRWSRDWTIDVRLPLEGDVRWWPSEHVSLGAQWQVKGGEYRASGPPLPYDTVQVTEGTFAAVLGLGGRSGPQFELSSGQSLFRHYRALKDGQKQVALDFAPARFVSAAVSWRY
jgi:hypothetical protein